MNRSPNQEYSGSARQTPAKIPVLPLNTNPSSYSAANRRTVGCPVQRVYPWLLFASTFVAAVFCLAYITKPVVMATSSVSPRQGAMNAGSDGNLPDEIPESMVPDGNELPGTDRSPLADTPPASPLASDFEETNIRIQHVLDAEFPSGDVKRIIVDVPVLYRSRNLRWSLEETERARDLLERLTSYQQRTRDLRDEGTALLNEWNGLMSASIPGQALRADSPSLPSNQVNGLLTGAPAASDTVETIKLKQPER